MIDEDRLKHSLAVARKMVEIGKSNGLAEDELKEAKKAIKLLGGEIVKQESLQLDNKNIERNLIVIKKVSTTPKKYPRKPGMPAKQPI